MARIRVSRVQAAAAPKLTKQDKRTLREIKELQKSASLLINKPKFRKLCRSILQEVQYDTKRFFISENQVATGTDIDW